MVLATHSDQALALLADAAAREHEILGAIPYQRTRRCSTPTSAAAAPPAGVGELELPPAAEPKPVPTVTYHMNRLQSLRAEREFCVTLNRTEAIDPAKMIKRIAYAHPVYTAAGVEAQARLAEINGAQPDALRGAYWGGASTRTACEARLRVAERFGGRL